MRPMSRTAAVLLAGLIAGLAACVPTPANRPSPPPPTAIPTATPTPSPIPAGPTPTPSFVRPTPTPLPTFLTYVVRSGDTLSSIARRFDTTVDSIAAWNRDTYPSLDPESAAYAPNRIEVGWILVLIPGAELDISELPERSPSPTPGSSPSATAGPSPTPAGVGGPSTRVANGPRASMMVALTFDLGGRLDPALGIMDWLIDHEVSATIFPTGRTASTTAIGREVLARLRAHPDRFDLGNHSWSHPDFRDLTAAAVRDELTRTEAALQELAGTSPRPWFRPPFGGVDATVLDWVGAAGYASTVLWDVDAIDWRPVSDGGPTADDLVATVVGKARGGSIVLMHLGGYHTAEALPGIVAGLRERGLTPVTLGTLLGG